MLSQEIQERLARPIDPSRVKKREGSRGASLSYIEAHDAIRTANDIFGVGGWDYQVVELAPLGEPEEVERNGRKGFRVGYGAIVLVNVYGEQGETFSFSDTGYGDAVEYTGSRITPHELARKEAVSDALKRALKNLGDQFGLGLYDAKRRADVERRAKVGSSVAAMKRAVMQLATERLGREPEKVSEVSKLFGVRVADLQEEDVLRRILTDEGLL